jgi:hypothetical protein
MDFHDKDFFDRLMTLTEENNRLLHKMWRAARVARAARVVYWVILIGVSIGAYYYIQPYIDQFLSMFGGLGETIKAFQTLVGS